MTGAEASAAFCPKRRRSSMIRAHHPVNVLTPVLPLDSYLYQQPRMLRACLLFVVLSLNSASTSTKCAHCGALEGLKRTCVSPLTAQNGSNAVQPLAQRVTGPQHSHVPMTLFYGPETVYLDSLHNFSIVLRFWLSSCTYIRA